MLSKNLKYFAAELNFSAVKREAEKSLVPRRGQYGDLSAWLHSRAAKEMFDITALLLKPEDEFTVIRMSPLVVNS